MWLTVSHGVSPQLADFKAEMVWRKSLGEGGSQEAERKVRNWGQEPTLPGPSLSDSGFHLNHATSEVGSVSKLDKQHLKGLRLQGAWTRQRKDRARRSSEAAECRVT